LPDYLALLESQEEFQTEYQTYWKSTSNLTVSKLPVDGVIMPVCANAACLENTLSYFGQSQRLGVSVRILITISGYSAIVNLLDFTAVTFPVGLIDKDMDPKLGSLFAPVSREDEATHQSCMHTHFVLIRLQITDMVLFLLQMIPRHSMVHP
jgi:hypothetical protein